MNPKRTANELIVSFLLNDKSMTHSAAVSCAKVACNLLINEHTSLNPLRLNVERHNHYVNVLKELNSL